MYIEANGIRMRCEVSGAGPWLMLSHSLACDLSMWEPQIEALAQRFTLLRWDTRGHGGSAAPPGPYDLAVLAADALALMDELGIARAHFVGLSMGGMIGQQLALGAPARLSSLTLADTTSRYPPEMRPVWDERMRLVREQGVEAVVEGTLARWFTEDYRKAHAAIVGRIGDLIRATPIEGYLGCCAAIAAIDFTDRLRGLSVPTLVIVGEQDPGTPVSMAREIAAAIPAARLEIIASAAHLSNIEQAAEFNRILLNFLENNPSPAG
jgi:3-oxoadipate enol-lactonase